MGCFGFIKGDEKEWKSVDNGERSYLERESLERVFLDLQNKERRLEVEPAMVNYRVVVDPF